MSIENVKKLELCKKLLHESLHVESDELGDKMFDDGYKMMKDLIRTKDTDVLCGLMDLFYDKDIEVNTGVCETLENEIFQYFTMEQILLVLEKKLSDLINLNVDRAIHFVGACDIEEIKKLMITLPFLQANEFLIKLKDRCRKELSEQIVIFQKNTEKW